MQHPLWNLHNECSLFCVDRSDLDPFAKMLVPAYLDTAAYSRWFRDEYGTPPTQFEKIHHLRSIVGAKVNQAERYDLGEAFTEYGRVEITDEETGHQFLLRSVGAVSVEQAKAQGRLFTTTYLRSAVTLLVYRFHRDGLDLAIAGTRQLMGKQRLEPSGPPIPVGTWALTLDTGTRFEQGAADAFGELGGLTVEKDETGEQ